MKEIEFINAKMNRQDVQAPQLLYKYRPFDGFTFDMLDNAYAYLCPAEKLDDPSECKVDFTVQDFYDLRTIQLTLKGVEMILEFLKPYTSDENFQIIRSLVARTLMPQGTVRRNFLLDVSFDMQELVPSADITPVINWLGSIPDKLNEPKMRYKFMELFSLARDARRDMGICSLSELSNSNEMWNNYADDSQGYCIEYDMREYETLYALFPVVYQDNRENNIVTSILSAFIGEMIFGMSNRQIVVDKSHFMRLFLTKDLVWAYQKEWRLLGDANQKLSAPLVNAIYLGKNMPEKDKHQMIYYCKSHNITVRQSL
ncbi:MAG: DUF2971 domain-containing protein [Lachnospiraceae bacterium]|nr:DUF2971 domain-containing protein [Lachnospiraceae bacterium]